MKQKANEAQVWHEVHCQRVFIETEKALKSGAETVIHKGGTGSGKTYEIMLYIILEVLLKKKNKICSVVSESNPHLEICAMRIMDEIIDSLGLRGRIRMKKKIVYFQNNNLLEFFSVDRIGKALGARRYLLFGNEINTLNYKIFDELARRSKIVIADFNPVAEFWLEKEFLPFYEPYKIIKSNYLDNFFCPQHEKDRLAKRMSMDENFKRIHFDCEYGSIEDLVFKPEKIILIDDFPKDLRVTYGLDFGFIAPSVLVKVAVADDKVFIDEIFYKTGLNEAGHLDELKKIDRKDKIIGDSEDQRMISYIYSMGYNIHAAKKPKGSVNFGISYLQGRQLYITKRSFSTIKEFRNLMNERDRLGRFTGKFGGENHAVDAVRYAIEDFTNFEKVGFSKPSY